MAKRSLSAASANFDTLAGDKKASSKPSTQASKEKGKVVPIKVVEPVSSEPEATTTASDAPTTAKVAKVRTPAPDGGFKIEQGIAIPEGRGGGGKAKYPWSDMDKDDTFFVAGGKIATFHTLCSSSSKRFDVKFICRKWTEKGVDGVRVWRTE